MRKRINKLRKTRFLYLLATLFLTGCQGAEKPEIPDCFFTTSFPRRFLNPEKVLGSPFIITEGNDTVKYIFRFDRSTRSSSVLIIRSKDTSEFNNLYLNRYLGIYFWNKQEEENHWKIAAFTLTDTTADNFSDAIVFNNNQFLSNASGTEHGKPLVKEKSSYQIVFEGKKKELYRLFYDQPTDSKSRIINTNPSRKDNLKGSTEETENRESEAPDFPSTIRVYPNPAKGNVTVSGIKPGHYIALKNSEGDAVRVVEARNEKEVIDLSGINPGNYYIKLADPDLKTTETFRLTVE
jgi:hypothetical protein